ncbi:MAG: glycosyltransferase [Pseudomonadota bacterium]
MRIRRAVILSGRNTFLTRTGAAEYLAGLARALGSQGIAVSILFLDPPPAPMLRQRLHADYRALFETYRMRGTARLGGHLYVRDPARWWGRFRGASGAGPGVARPGPGLQFARPDRAALDWAGGWMRRLRPDLVIANYFNAAPALARAPQGALRAILVHDVLALRRDSFAATGAVPDFDPALIAEEAVAFRAADLCLAIKEEEAAHIRSLAPEGRVAVYPVTLPAGQSDLDAPRPPACIFVGGENPPNRAGLAWFLDSVWPALRAARPALTLRVVGAVGRHLPEPLPAGVERRGFAEDLATEYAAAAVAVTPIPFGSGVKVKLIEALAEGLPVVSTRIGAEGVAPADPAVLRIADTAEDFAAGVLAALDAPDGAALRHAARGFARTHHHAGTVAPRLVALLQDRAAASGADRPILAKARS